MYSGSTRARSGSVDRRSASREPAPYRTAYGRERDRAPQSNSTTASRFSRATSYDPFASGKTRVAMPNNFPSPYGRSGMSSSYNSDYKTLSNRYGSTEQLSSSSSTYKSPYSTSSSSYRSPATSSTSTSYNSPRRAGSVGVGFSGELSSARSGSQRDLTTVGFSRYRPTDSAGTSGYSSALSKYRAESTTSDVGSRYQSSYSRSNTSSASSTPTSNRVTF
ncbi:unnamed protein product [Caenorhabditis auriculariae]|uniref:Uncharacterized protein n=1 Tax=Caenorhabditis auriculariae TaxID=2777116 RepID=A0A8S1HSA3_9PELO|nr:unnamed protein product [Caenorhabditis auriculariae]